MTDRVWLLDDDVEDGLDGSPLSWTRLRLRLLDDLEDGLDSSLWSLSRLRLLDDLEDDLFETP